MAAQPASSGPVEPLDFDSLLTQHGQRVYAFVHRVVGHESADDVCQEVWLAIYRALPSFRGEARVTTWMYTIAARVCDHHRRRPQLSVIEGEAADDLGDDRAGPLQSALAEELSAVVRACIDQLPEGQRETVHLRCAEDLSYAEIAQVLHIPIGTVRSRLHHGTARLAELLAPYLETTHERK